MLRPTIVALAVLSPLALGCARRPVTMLTIAPAPEPGASQAMQHGQAAGALRRAAGKPAAGAASPATRPVSATPPSPSEFAPEPELADIHFDFDRYDLRPDVERTLDRHAAWLRAHPGDLVLIEAHCDERGTSSYNLALGDRRATMAKNYLVAQGVSAARIATLSYGEERPLCTEHGEACWAKNRRARFLVKPQ
jgi:peptidoglycan-associated lipoprotein